MVHLGKWLQQRPFLIAYALHSLSPLKLTAIVQMQYTIICGDCWLFIMQHCHHTQHPHQLSAEPAS